jgi:hypothetical protein
MADEVVQQLFADLARRVDRDLHRKVVGSIRSLYVYKNSGTLQRRLAAIVTNEPARREQLLVLMADERNRDARGGPWPKATVIGSVICSEVDQIWHELGDPDPVWAESENELHPEAVADALAIMAAGLAKKSDSQRTLNGQRVAL